MLPLPVETVPVRRQDLNEVIGGSGSIEQAQTVQLTSQITAQVLEVPVKIGDVVKKGAVCSVRWDDRLIQATLEANRDYVEVEQDQDQGRDPTGRALHSVATEEHGNTAGAGEERDVVRRCKAGARQGDPFSTPGGNRSGACQDDRSSWMALCWNALLILEKTLTAIRS